MSNSGTEVTVSLTTVVHVRKTVVRTADRKKGWFLDFYAFAGPKTVIREGERTFPVKAGDRVQVGDGVGECFIYDGEQPMPTFDPGTKIEVQITGLVRREIDVSWTRLDIAENTRVISATRI
jgi:hypothetical protein